MTLGAGVMFSSRVKVRIKDGVRVRVKVKGHC